MEDEETPLPILTSDSHNVPVTKYDIDTLFCEGIVVDDDNDPDTENVLHSEEVLPDPKTPNFGFKVIDPWCKSGNVPVGKAKFKTLSNISIQHMPHLEFFVQL